MHLNLADVRAALARAGWGRAGAGAMSAGAPPRRRPAVVVGEATVEAEYGRDTWDANRLGARARRNIARFGVIPQRWLRQSIKQ